MSSLRAKVLIALTILVVAVLAVGPMAGGDPWSWFRPSRSWTLASVAPVGADDVVLLEVTGRGEAYVERVERTSGPVWRQKLPDPIGSTYQQTFVRDVIVSDDLVIVKARSAEPKTERSTVSAYALADGALRWRRPSPLVQTESSLHGSLVPTTAGVFLDIDSTFASAPDPIADGGSLPAPSRHEVIRTAHVAGVDPATGAERWHIDLPDALLRLRLRGTRLIAADTEGARVFDLVSGAERARYRTIWHPCIGLSSLWYLSAAGLTSTRLSDS